MSKGKSTGERKPTWNNVQRVNKQNQFVPLAVQTRTGINPVNTAKASSTNNFSTARQKVNNFNTVKPIVNGVRPTNVFHKTHSPSSRPFKRTTVLRTNFSNQKVYTVKVKEVSTVGGKWDTADNPHRTLQNKGIIDSGCSRHMTGNKAYLADFQDFNGGPVAFGGSKGYITGKGKIKTGKGPNWLFDLDYLTDSMNYHNVSSKNQANIHAGQQESNQNAGTKDKIVAGDSEKEDESAQDCFEVPFWHSYSSTNTSSSKSDKKRGSPREEEQVFLDDLAKLQMQEKEAIEEAEALTKNLEQENENLVTQAEAAKTSGTNIISTVSTTAKASEDDYEIPPLEDIHEDATDGIFTHSSYDDEGAVADFTNLETIVNVSPIPTSRVHPSPSSHSFKEILTSAVQTRIKFNLVDDIIFGSTKKSWCDEFEALMKSRFQMSSMGELTFFLGLQVKQKPDGIFISQDKYVAEILKKFDFASVKTASTPIETQKPLVKDEEANDVDVHLYRSMIGSLMYVTASRPDIMFAVCACSRFQVTPKTSHLSAVKRIFRYLKGKPSLGLWYPRESSFDLESYSDSDYAGANLDRKSTTGGCQFLGRRLITWQCKKQTIVATSTTEAEYVAAASCCGQVLWIQNQMLDYGFNFMNTKIYIDNESTICIMKNPPISVLGCFNRDDKSLSCIGYREAIWMGHRFNHHQASIANSSNKWSVLLLVATEPRNCVVPNRKPKDKPQFKANKAALNSVTKAQHDSILEKTEGNVEFHEVIDFLQRSYIFHALTVSPVISTTFVEQFWTSAKSKTINNVRHITAKVAGKVVSISEASIRTNLIFNDADGIDSLPNQAIFI
ncbi:putative ribonuclease H-like domain-containing protein [Tanacetum coccineum]